VGINILSIEKELEELVDHIQRAAREEAELVGAARDVLFKADFGRLQETIIEFQSRQERAPWLVAIPQEALDTSVPSQTPPPEFTVIASDGSFIPPDRHSPIHFFLLNMGQATMHYGESSFADLSSRAKLYFRPSETFVRDENGFDMPIEGSLLSWKMAVEELAFLLDTAVRLPPPLLAIRDGSLILWGLQGESKDIQKEFLYPALRTIGRFKEEQIPIVSYISYPGSRDVCNALRVWLCPEDPLRCRCEEERDRALCNFLRTSVDRTLFQGILQKGNRSAVFSSSSGVLDLYGEHRIQFFYLNVGSEIVRVEAPQWVFEAEGWLDFVQAVLIDQARRGEGYPPALMEAHEQAVVSMEERRTILRLLENELGLAGVSLTRSSKDRSKRIRGV